MKSVVNSKNVHSFAYVNDAVCRKPVKGLILDFMGLGGASMFKEDTETGVRFGEKGILYVIPYLNPWNWMNPQAVQETDEIVAAVFDLVGVSGLPVVSSGGSMGGLACLVYTKYAAVTPVACVANCPVCDLPYHFTERPDLPRTLYSAFYGSDYDTIEEAMENASPLHLAQKKAMPEIPYTIYHCEADKAVNKQMHSDRFVKAMEAYHPVSYIAVPERGHCDLPAEVREQYYQTMENAIFAN